MYKKLFEPPDQNRIMICTERHGNRYFSAYDSDKVFAACLKLVKERIKNNYYTVRDEPIPPTFTRDEIKNSNDSLQDKESYLGAWAMYDIDMYKYTELWCVCNDAATAASTNDGRLACDVIMRRSKMVRDYERVVFTTLEDVSCP